MKTIGLLPMAVITMFALSACGSNVSAAPLSANEIISSANTSVALTSRSQIQMATTSTAPPAATFTLSSTPPPTTITAALIRPITAQPIDSEPAGTSNYPSLAGISNCDNSAYVSDVSISDGTVFLPGKTFTKTWKIKNTGTCIWNSHFAIAFSSGDSMSGTTTTIRRAVPPNGTGNISVELTAPETAGTYTGYWIMTNSSGTPFGNYFYVQIVVAPDEEETDSN
jgi:hypothetical protein